MSNTDTAERTEKRNALDAFAAAPSQVQAPPVQPLASVVDRVFGAQAVAVYRDEARVLQKLSALGAAAGSDWFYRFPVKNKAAGRTDWIEGASIKLANDLARIYGNCDVDVRVTDIGREWVIYARFTDFETGYSLTRPFQQQKGGAKIGGADDARRLDIALQIGVSKAIRNVVVNALQTFADHAFDAARNSLVERIGKDVKSWTERTLKGIENLGVPLDLVEFQVGRVAKDWTAPDVAKVIAMMKAIADGMATIEETFPSKDKQTEEDQPQAGAGDGERQSGAAEAGASASGETHTSQTDAPANSNNAASQQQDGGTASKPAEAGQPAASTAAPPKGSDKAAGTAGEAEQVVPTTEKQWLGYVDGWIDELTSSAEGEVRWKKEKDLRNKANVSEEAREGKKMKLDAKIADLKKLGK